MDDLPASDPREAIPLPKKATTRWSVFLQGVREILPAQWILLTVGISSLAYSQYLMESRNSTGSPAPLAELWNALYRLEIINYDNVYHALPYFLVGTVLCILFATPISWKQDSTHWVERRGLIKGNSQKQKIVIALVLTAFVLIQLGNHYYTFIHPLLWMLAIGLFTHVLWSRDRNAGVDTRLKVSILDLFWMTLLLILGFAVTSYGLEDLPMHMIPDEGSFWETARAIARGELRPPFFDSGVYTFPVASSIYQGWILRIFGVDFWSWRFSSVVPAVVTIVPLYLLTREWFGRSTAILASLFMVGNPFFIAFARFGYNNSQSLFPVILCIYFFAMAVGRGSRLYLWLAGLSAGFGFYTYSSSWIGIVTLCLSIALLWLQRSTNFRQALSILGIVLFGWMIVYLPRVAYTASGSTNDGLVYKIFETSFVSDFYARAYYGDAEITARADRVQIGKYPPIYYEPVIYREMLFRGTVRTVLALFNPHIVHEHFMNSAFAGVISPIFLVVGIAIGLRNRKQLRFGMLFVWFVASLFFLSIIGAFPPRHTHLVSIIPCLAMLSAVGLSGATQRLVELAFSQRARWGLLLQPIVIAVIAWVSLYLGIQRYFVEMPDDYPPAFEDVSSWLAWKANEPLQIIFLSRENVPHRVKYLVDAKVVPHSYAAYTLDEFSINKDVPPAQPVLIFLETQDAKDLAVLSNLPKAFQTPVSYRYRDQYIIGFATTNTSLELEPRVDATSLTRKPVRFVLLGLLILLGGFGVILARNRSGIPRKDFLIELGKKPGDEEQAEGSERMADFYLRLRIGFNKRNRS